MLAKIKSYFFFGENEREIYKYKQNNAHARKFSNAQAHGVVKKKILVDCSHLGYSKWNLKLMLIINNRMRHNDCEVHGFYPSRLLVWKSYKNVIIFLIKLLYNKDVLVSKAIGVAKLMPIGVLDYSVLIDAYKKASIIRSRISCKKDLLELCIDDVHVGDLVYDNYLKWFKRPTISFSDKKLLIILTVACYFSSKFHELFDKNNYSEVYLTHSVYIAFGFAARISLSKGADVYVTQNTRGLFLQRLTVAHPHQTPRFNNYKEEFSTFSAVSKILATSEAKEKLNDRLNGCVDSSIAYMRKSAYSPTEGRQFSLVEHFPGRPYALIMLHCFFDSPHIYKWMLFEDFYEWASHCLSFLQANEFNVVVKPHPNGLNGNTAVVRDLQKQFTKANFLTGDISNKDVLMMEKCRVALTVYGTVAHEFCYMGLPVLNAGDNPHVSFNFSVTPRTVSEFNSRLTEIMHGNSWCIEKPEIEQFYYMHYLSNKPGSINSYADRIEAALPLTCDYLKLFSALATIPYESLDSEIDKCFSDLKALTDVV